MTPTPNKWLMIHTGDEDHTKLIKKKNIIIDGFSFTLTGIRYGAACCTHLLPTYDDIKSMQTFAKEQELRFTLVVPSLMDAQIDEALTFIDLLKDGDGLVANDWGFAYAAKERYEQKNKNIRLGIGRLLSTNKKDPRIREHTTTSQEHKNPTPLWMDPKNPLQHYISPASIDIDHPIIAQQMNENKVTQNKMDQNNMTDTTIILHLPFTHLTTTRFCPWRHAYEATRSGTILIHSKRCQQYCKKVSALLHNNETQDILLKGNTQSYREYNNKSIAEMIADISQKTKDKALITDVVIHLSPTR